MRSGFSKWCVQGDAALRLPTVGRKGSAETLYRVRDSLFPSFFCRQAAKEIHLPRQGKVLHSTAAVRTAERRGENALPCRRYNPSVTALNPCAVPAPLAQGEPRTHSGGAARVYTSAPTTGSRYLSFSLFAPQSGAKIQLPPQREPRALPRRARILLPCSNRAHYHKPRAQTVLAATKPCSSFEFPCSKKAEACSRFCFLLTLWAFCLFSCLGADISAAFAALYR